MTDSNTPTVSDVFKLLNRWRHLPGYPLEGRSAPFFALFLRDILRDRFGEMHDVVIPEFPLRQGTLDSGDSNLSYNVDYVAFSKDKGTAYLVELKTDMDSKRPKQEEYLCKARKVPFSSLVEGVRELAKGSDKKQKYVHLLHRLSEAELVSKCDELYGKSFPKCVPGWTKAIKKLQFERKCWKTKVVFIQPEKGKSASCAFEYIYFGEVANIVKQHGDLGSTFAKFLKQWIEEPGSVDPKTLHRS